MNPLISLILMGLLSTLFGCGHLSKVNPDILEDISSRTDTSEGFSDIFLHITGDLKDEKSHTYTAKGLYKNKVVGVKVEIVSNIPYGISANGEVNSKSGFVKDGVRFISIGEESDKLLNALAELYNFPTKKPFSKSKVTATIFSLNQEVADLDKNSYYKFKLFFNEDGDENEYAELYLNISTEKKLIELHEKDHEYRQPILRAFAR